MQKESSFLFTALGGHVLQNIAGAKLVKSRGFLEDTAKALMSGALARNARKGTLKEAAKTAVTSVGVPEAIMAQHRAFEAGRTLYARARAMGIDPNKLTKKEAAKMRMVAEGRLPDKHSTPLTERAKSLLGSNTLPKGTIKADAVKQVTSRPMGSLSPHSRGAIITGNAIASIAEPGIGALNAAKFGTELKSFQNTRLGKYVEKNMVQKPLTDAFQSGAAGKAMNNLKSFGYKYGVNGAVGQAIEGAHKLGSNSMKKLPGGISKK
jgi:hypothetical protein